MNKTKLMVAAFAAIALSACADSKDAGPKGIPEDLVFTVQKGTPLSTAEIANINALVKQIAEASKKSMTGQYSEFLIADATESDTEKAERNKKYAALSDEQKAELENAKKVCNLKERTQQKIGNQQDGKGTAVTTASISGPGCPVQYKENTSVTADLDIKKDGAYSGTMKIKNETTTERTDNRSAAMANEITSQSISVNATGTLEGSNGSSRSFNSGAMGMGLNVANFGYVKVDGDFKMLSKESQDKYVNIMILQADLTAGGRTYKLSLRTQSNPEGKSSEMEVYLNGSKIDASALEGLD